GGEGAVVLVAADVGGPRLRTVPEEHDARDQCLGGGEAGVVGRNGEGDVPAVGRQRRAAGRAVLLPARGQDGGQPGDGGAVADVGVGASVDRTEVGGGRREGHHRRVVGRRHRLGARAVRRLAGVGHRAPLQPPGGGRRGTARRVSRRRGGGGRRGGASPLASPRPGGGGHSGRDFGDDQRGDGRQTEDQRGRGTSGHRSPPARRPLRRSAVGA